MCPESSGWLPPVCSCSPPWRWSAPARNRIEAAPGRADAAAAAIGPPATAMPWSPDALNAVDVVVLAAPAGHRAVAEVALERGAHVVSVADGLDEVRSLLDLDAEARERALVVAVGAAFGPGLSCVLARHAAAGFDAVDEVHVARSGTG